jgi:ABC-type Mn2+/Zn2+ transport system ATPase subunit
MLIEFERVEVGYHRRAILPPVNLRLEPRAFWGIVGPNGSGKTTLLRTLLGLLPPVRGEIRRPRGRRLRTGYVRQREETDSSWPLTALEIALMSRFPRIGLFRQPSRADAEIARAALGKVGMADHADARFHSLSGGQRQRVLTARALAGEPELLVLDEPTTGMDLVAEHGMLELIAGFAAQGIAVVMVSHRLDSVANVAQYLMLVDRERGLVDSGLTAEVLTAERLSRLYRAPIAVTETRGHRDVFIDPGAKSAR